MKDYPSSSVWKLWNCLENLGNIEAEHLLGSLQLMLSRNEDWDSLQSQVKSNNSAISWACTAMRRSTERRQIIQRTIELWKLLFFFTYNAFSSVAYAHCFVFGLRHLWKTSLFSAVINILWANTKITRFSCLQAHMVLFNFFKLSPSQKVSTILSSKQEPQKGPKWLLDAFEGSFSDENLSAESVLDSWLQHISSLCHTK